MIRAVLKNLVLIGLAPLALAACHEQDGPTTAAPQEPLVLATAQQVGQMMAKTCFASLPDFANFDDAARAAGLIPGPARGPARSPFFLPGTTSFVDTVNSPEGTVCVASVESSDGKEAVGKAFLSAARAALGGSGEPQPTSFYAIARYMPNGSLITQDFRSAPGRSDMNILGVTHPIAKSQIATFIYN